MDLVKFVNTSSRDMGIEPFGIVRAGQYITVDRTRADFIAKKFSKLMGKFFVIKELGQKPKERIVASPAPVVNAPPPTEVGVDLAKNSSSETVLSFEKKRGRKLGRKTETIVVNNGE